MIVDVMLRNRLKHKSDIVWARTREDLFSVFYRLVRKKSSNIRFFRYFRERHGARILFKGLWHSGSAASYKQVGRVRTQCSVTSNLERAKSGKNWLYLCGHRIPWWVAMVRCCDIWQMLFQSKSGLGHSAGLKSKRYFAEIPLCAGIFFLLIVSSVMCR